MVRLAVCARYPAVRAGIRAMVASRADIETVGEAASPDELAAQHVEADVLVWALDDADRLDDLPSDLRLAGVVLLGDELTNAIDLAALDIPWAWLSRDAEAREIVAAIDSVAAGLIAIDPSAARGVLRLEQEQQLMPSGTVEEPLTPREAEVLQLMAEGLPNKAIARRLGISEHTVKFHVASVLGKLGASSRTEAVRLGVRAGLVIL